MMRIMVVGSGGSGKSTFSRQLGAILGLPVVHLDAHYWRAGWEPTPAEQWTSRMRELASAPQWIIDGNYGGTIDIRVSRCDTVIFLDLPRLVCVWRVLLRQLRFRGRTRPDMAPGCPERLTWEFVEWIWTYPVRHRRTILDSLRKVRPDQRAVVLTSGSAVKKFLRDTEAGASPAASIRTSSTTRSSSRPDLRVR